MANLQFTFKKGEVGKEIPFTLSDADGAFDLTGWTVTLAIARSKSAAPVATGKAVTKRTQSGATLGQCYHTLDADTANIPAGVYKACELKLTASGGQVLYWPVNSEDKRTYFTVEVQTPLS